jgi:hypothetical protein
LETDSADGATFGAALAQTVTPAEGIGLALAGPFAPDSSTFIALHGPGDLSLNNRGRSYQDNDYVRRWTVIQGLDGVRRAALGQLSSPVDWN